MDTKIDVDELVTQSIAAAKDAFSVCEFHRAEALLGQVQKVGFTSPEVEHLLALSMHRQGKNKLAREILIPLIEEYDDHWEYHNTLGVVYSMLGDREEACKEFTRACELNPNALVAFNNQALERYALGDGSQAFELIRYAKCLDITPEERGMLEFNMGNFHMDENLMAEAEVFFKEAKKLSPSFCPARWNLAAALLSQGKYEEGWAEYESRWEQFPDFRRTQERFADKPVWEGGSLEGKTILLYTEQGAGDTIQFVRFTRNLKALGATVLLEWKNAAERGDLRTILEQIPWIDRLVRVGEECEYDYHQSLISLPRVLQIHAEGDFWYGPYIKPDTEFAPELKDHHWRKYEGKKKVGIVWAGSPSHHNDPKRSYPMQHFAAFNLPGIQLFSLQKDIRRRVWPRIGTVDLAEGLDYAPIVDLSPMMVDYNATANLISKMDLIVSVDTGVAHLAGSMGKDVFLMLHRTNDWRWGIGRDQTLWYPSMTIFRGSWHFATAAGEACSRWGENHGTSLYPLSFAK